jgi:hypothetical protein
MTKSTGAEHSDFCPSCTNSYDNLLFLGQHNFEGYLSLFALTVASFALAVVVHRSLRWESKPPHRQSKQHVATG